MHYVNAINAINESLFGHSCSATNQWVHAVGACPARMGRRVSALQI